MQNYIVGIGGIFFRSKNPQESREWYLANLGLQSQEWGASFPWFLSKEDQQSHLTNWSPFSGDADYFGDSDQEFMINYIVKDMDGLLTHLEKQGVMQVKPKETHEYGTFAWVNDNEGRRIELWEPILGVL